MTNQEILTKAIQKASPALWGKSVAEVNLVPYKVEGWQDPMWLAIINFDDGSGKTIVADANLIFNHDFAKALWGEARDVEKYAYYLEGELFDYKTPEEFKEIEQAGEDDNSWERYEPIYKNKGWQYHLQQMVMAIIPLW